MTRGKISESDIMGSICDYLDIEMARGHLYFDRLNSGNILAAYGDKKYRVKLCREGTADLMVLKNVYYQGMVGYRNQTGYICRVIYLELKGQKGKITEAQWNFKAQVEEQGAEYYVVRDVEQVMEILG